MGNCFTQSAKTWAIDDHWDRFEPTSYCESTQHKKEVSPKAGSTIVKIKVSKKQLEEILQNAGIDTGKGLPIELLLKQAMNKRREEPIRNRTPQWRPALQTIVEAAE